MKTITKSIFAITVSSMLLSSCASILTPGKPSIKLWGLPETERVDVITEAKVYRNVTLPIKVKVKRHAIDNQPVIITSKTTHKEHVIYLKKTFNPWASLNIGLGGGVIGLGIDCVTNCISVPSKTKYCINPADLGLTVGDSIDDPMIKSAKSIDLMFE